MNGCQQVTGPAAHITDAKVVAMTHATHVHKKATRVQCFLQKLTHKGVHYSTEPTQKWWLDASKGVLHESHQTEQELRLHIARRLATYLSTMGQP